MTKKFTTVQSFDFLNNKNITSSVINSYKNDGVICLRGAVSNHWLKIIEKGISEFLKNKIIGGVPSSVAVKHEGDKGSFYYGTLMWKEIGYFRSMIFDSGLPKIFGKILETEFINLYYDFLLIKEAGCSSAITPWHQDHSYYCLHGEKIINCWTALDKIPEETSLRFVKGSHKNTMVHRAIHFDPKKEYKNTMNERPKPPDFDNDPSSEILCTKLEPGDTLVWNSKTFHSAPGNNLNSRRAALSLNLAGDDVTYFDMKQEPDPPIRGENLKEGSPITCESFPLL